MSLLDDALALNSQGRRLRRDESDTTELNRLSARISELRAVLAELRGLVHMFRVAQAAGAPASVSPTKVDSGREYLARRASEGFPNDAAFSSAKSRVTSAVKQAKAGLEIAWKDWARDEVAQLPRERLTRLPKKQRTAADKTWVKLAQLARKTPTNESSIAEFVTLKNELREILEHAPEVDRELGELIRRLEDSPALSLADLTDEQVVLLRQPDIADQVELRWRTT
jgi:hypothetical protein